MVPWRFKEALIRIVKDSTEKYNKPGTTVYKVRKFLNDNEDCLFHPENFEVVWKGEFEKLEAYRIVFENYNKGLYRFVNSSIKIRVSLIVRIYTLGEKFYVVIPDDHTRAEDSKNVRYSCSELDYKALNLIIDHGK